MNSYTQRFTEDFNPLAAEYADSQAAGTHNGTWVSLQNYHRAVFVLNVGEMQAGATLDAGIQQATDTSGTGAKAITGKTITQLTQAGEDGDQLIAIELATEELDNTNNFDSVRFYVTIANAAVEYSAILYGFVSRFDPVPTTNWTEIVT
jgi:hypothetical protein